MTKNERDATVRMASDHGLLASNAAVRIILSERVRDLADENEELRGMVAMALAGWEKAMASPSFGGGGSQSAERIELIAIRAALGEENKE
jgi:hypothetical protein